MMNHHIPDGDLLRVVDGELPKDRTAQINEHLAACWMCRARLNDFEQTIHRFVRAHLNGFESRITEIDGPRALLRARIMELEKAESHSWRDRLSAALQQWRVQAYFAVAALIAFAIVLFPVSKPRRAPSKVTVPGVLSQAELGERVQLSKLTRPVIYQKIQIRVQGRDYNRSIYRDTTNARRVARLQSVARPTSAQDADHALHPVERAFTEAKLDWDAPLSPSRLSGWRSGLQIKTDRVDEDRSTTQISTATPDGPIAEATVKFRNADYHPISETLRLRDNSVVEIAELDYKIVELNQLSADVFGMRAARTDAIPIAAAGVGLELEVIQRLDHANALMGEQVSVERNRNSIQVRGVVDSKQRRDEIVRALAPVLEDPALKLDITVPAGNARTPRNVAHQSVEGIESFQRAPADGSLRDFFARNSTAGATTQEEVERFTDEVSLHSQSAKANALALKQIAERFSPDDLNAMTPEEHRQWREMLQSHASAVLKETRLMRENLEPVFHANTDEKRPSISELKSDADLIDAAAKLSDLAMSNDSAVWHSFAASTEASNVTLVCLPEFWDSLLDTEILAQEISVGAKYEPRFKGPLAQTN